MIRNTAVTSKSWFDYRTVLENSPPMMKHINYDCINVIKCRFLKRMCLGLRVLNEEYTKTAFLNGTHKSLLQHPKIFRFRSNIDPQTTVVRKGGNEGFSFRLTAVGEMSRMSCWFKHSVLYENLILDTYSRSVPFSHSDWTQKSCLSRICQWLCI